MPLAAFASPMAGGGAETELSGQISRPSGRTTAQVGGNKRRVLLFIALINQGLLGCFLAELWALEPIAFFAQFGFVVAGWCVALFIAKKLSTEPGVDHGDLLAHQRWLFRAILAFSVLDMELLPLMPWACPNSVVEEHDGFPT